eukprot:GEMP01027693.1.p3 GENE.GEMP01027693.1~~GEMP01027693.1.p3  ORF type:complete len:114 (+),score=28.23 GEMP01027693.1:317-658(+)
MQPMHTENAHDGSLSAEQIDGSLAERRRSRVAFAGNTEYQAALQELPLKVCDDEHDEAEVHAEYTSPAHSRHSRATSRVSSTWSDGETRTGNCVDDSFYILKKHLKSWSRCVG